MSKEEIDHPDYYNGETTYECIKVLNNWLPSDEYKGFLRGNIIKYICRYQRKENSIIDLKKALWYLNELIRNIEEEKEEQQEEDEEV